MVTGDLIEQQVTAPQLANIAEAVLSSPSWRTKNALCISSAPGAGKTSIIRQVAEKLGHDTLFFHGMTKDRLYFAGHPSSHPDEPMLGIMKPYQDMQAIWGAKADTTVILDDFHLPDKWVQGAVMQLIQERRLDQNHVPDCVAFVVLMNRKKDRAGQEFITQPFKERCCQLELSPDPASVVQYLLTKGVHPLVSYHLRACPDHLIDDADPSPDLVNRANPRSWEKASDDLHLGLPFSNARPMLVGHLGPRIGLAFAQTVLLGEKLPDPHATLANPKTAPIPDDQEILAIFCEQLAYTATLKTQANLYAYAFRLHAEGRGDAAAKILKDSHRRNTKDGSVGKWGAHDNKAFADLLVTDLGRNVMGIGLETK
jgi:hypothetical protein